MIDIVIATLKRPHLQKCLEALFKHTHVPFNLHLIEDGLNYAEAVNDGIRASRAANDIVLLDDDALVFPGWLDDLDRYLSQGDLLGSRLVYEDQNVITEMGLEFCRDENGGYWFRHAGDGQIDEGQYDRGPNYFPAVTTVAMYIKREVIENVGLLNEKDFRYGYDYEDWDYSFRAVGKGYRALCTNWKVRHLQSATKGLTEQTSFRRKLNRYVFRRLWFENEPFLSQMAAQFPVCESRYSVDPALAETLQSSRLAVYGAGSLFRTLDGLLDWNVCALLDADQSLWGKTIGRHTVKGPAMLPDSEFDILVVAVTGRSESIRRSLSTLLGETGRDRFLFLAYGFERRHTETSSSLFSRKEIDHLRIQKYIPSLPAAEHGPLDSGTAADRL
ncbi:MAG: glycosyltransferase family 2 protein [Acidobacteriota bacterium]